MSADPDARTAVELEAEQEVDFGRYWRLVAARWWLLVVGAVLGAVIGFLVTLGASKTYKATAEVYLGQPLAPDTASPVTTAPTTLGLVSGFATSEEAVRKAAADAGLKPGKLRGNITTKAIQGITTGRLGQPAPLLAVSVTGSSAGKTALASNSLADQIVGKVGAYTRTKIQTLEQQVQYNETELTAIEKRLAAARAQQQAILGDKSLSATEKLLGLSSINSSIVLDEQRRGNLEVARYTTARQLSLAKDLEQARVVSRAIGVKTEPTSRRTTVLVGAFIGLLLGIVAALLWEPIAARVQSRPA